VNRISAHESAESVSKKFELSSSSDVTTAARPQCLDFSVAWNIPLG
jgi:hypothetical protein